MGGIWQEGFCKSFAQALCPQNDVLYGFASAKAFLSNTPSCKILSKDGFASRFPKMALQGIFFRRMILYIVSQVLYMGGIWQKGFCESFAEAFCPQNDLFARRVCSNLHRFADFSRQLLRGVLEDLPLRNPLSIGAVWGIRFCCVIVLQNRPPPTTFEISS